MKKILQNPTARLRCLSALTGILLMTGVLLGEGQARTATPLPVMTSIQANKLNLPTHSSETVSTEISPVFKSIREQKTKDSVTHKQVADKNPEKKKMGMAILFLGILAEEG